MVNWNAYYLPGFDETKRHNLQNHHIIKPKLHFEIYSLISLPFHTQNPLPS